MTAHDYMLKAVHDIDASFGEGYARKSPQLVAAYMQVACADFVASSTAKVVGESIEEVSSALRGISEAL